MIMGAIVGCGKVKSDWKETIHTNEKYADFKLMETLGAHRALPRC